MRERRVFLQDSKAGQDIQDPAALDKAVRAHVGVVINSLVVAGLLEATN